MDFNRFTEKVQESLRTAQTHALRMQNQQVDVEHELVALLDQPNGLAQAILKKADLQPDALRQRLDQEINKLPKVSTQTGGPDQIYVTTRLTKLFADAEAEALAPAVRTVLDPAADPAARAAAITQIRTAGIALRSRALSARPRSPSAAPPISRALPAPPSIRRRI